MQLHAAGAACLGWLFSFRYSGGFALSTRDPYDVRVVPSCVGLCCVGAGAVPGKQVP
jgi:hypothetical protein